MPPARRVRMFAEPSRPPGAFFSWRFRRRTRGRWDRGRPCWGADHPLDGRMTVHALAARVPPQGRQCAHLVHQGCAHPLFRRPSSETDPPRTARGTGPLPERACPGCGPLPPSRGGCGPYACCQDCERGVVPWRMDSASNCRTTCREAPGTRRGPVSRTRSITVGPAGADPSAGLSAVVRRPRRARSVLGAGRSGRPPRPAPVRGAASGRPGRAAVRLFTGTAVAPHPRAVWRTSPTCVPRDGHRLKHFFSTGSSDTCLCGTFRDQPV